MKIGILGGTFDPIHLGHVAVATQALIELRLDRILFIPTGKPWMKAGSQITEADHRRKMVQLAIQGEGRFSESGIEIERGGLTFTIDTLRELNQTLEPGTQLFFIIGMDSAMTMYRWKDPERILELCTLVLVSRPDQTEFNQSLFNKIRAGAAEGAIRINTLGIDISADKIRTLLEDGGSIGGLVDPAVEEYIKEHNLYTGETNG